MQIPSHSCFTLWVVLTTPMKSVLGSHFLLCLNRYQVMLSWILNEFSRVLMMIDFNMVFLKFIIFTMILELLLFTSFTLFFTFTSEKHLNFSTFSTDIYCSGIFANVHMGKRKASQLFAWIPKLSEESTSDHSIRTLKCLLYFAFPLLVIIMLIPACLICCIEYATGCGKNQ